MSAAKTKDTAAAKPQPRDYDIIRGPVITEKATMMGQFNRVALFVAPEASKPEIKQAVERIFKVKVESVRTVNRAGKTKRFRGLVGQRPSTRKAYVQLAAGQTIDFGTTV